MSQLQITFSFENGADAKAIAARLRMQAGLLEGMNPKEAASDTNTLTDEPVAKAAPIKETKKKAAKPKVEDETFDIPGTTEAVEAMESFDEEPVEAKAPEISDEELQKACAAHAKTNGGREKTLAIIKKYSKTGMLKQIAQGERAKFMKALGV